MPRNGSGTYVPPGSTAAVSLATISSTAFNSLISDIGNEITNSLPTTGVKAMGADLAMGGFKITGLGTPSAATDGATKAYVDAAAGGSVVVSCWIGATSSGSANAQTVATLAPTTPAFTLAAGNRIVFNPGFSNSSAMTLTALALTAKNVFKLTTAGPVALTGGEIVAGQLVEVIYDGTQFILTDQAIPTITLTTTAQYWANSGAGTYLTPDKVWAAGATVNLPAFSGSAQAVDLNTGLNFVLNNGSGATANFTLSNPTNAKVGQTGFIRMVQDGTGSRIITWASNWLFAGGIEPALSTTAAAEDVLFYQVVTSSRIVCSLIKAVS